MLLCLRSTPYFLQSKSFLQNECLVTRAPLSDLNRLVWNEARFCFVQERDKNLGSNSLYRSEERIATEKRHLKRKWKSHIRLETYKSQDRTAMDVPRRQSVKL